MLTIALGRNLQPHTLEMEPLPLAVRPIAPDHLAVAHAVAVAVGRLVLVDLILLIFYVAAVVLLKLLGKGSLGGGGGGSRCPFLVTSLDSSSALGGP